MEVNITEFRSNIKKYIGTEFYLVSNDKIIGHFIPASRVSVQIEKKKQPDSVQNEEKPTPNVHFGNYACGCKKVDTRMCPKHQRI